MLSNFFGNKYQKFWNWFSRHSDEYLQLDDNKVESLFTKLNKQLKKVNENLTYEFSVELIDGNREFIISADGIHATFPDVIKLVEAAPKMDHFKIIAFRQRGKEFTIRYNEIELEPSDVFFSYKDCIDHIDIVLYIKGYIHDNEDWDGAVFILLDTIIGEYDVVMKIGKIEFRQFQADLSMKPIIELPEIVDNIQ